MRGMQCLVINSGRYYKCQPGVCLFIVGMTNADQGCYLSGCNQKKPADLNLPAGLI